MYNVEIKQIKCISDDRGNLYVSEYPHDLPFVVQRIYYISDVKDEIIKRGYHAHKKLEQILICLGGSCTIFLDNGKEKESIKLDSPSKALYLKPGVWREMGNFTNNATLLVLASDPYDETDYIRNYNEFKKYIEGKK